MAYSKFIDNIYFNRQVEVFGNGEALRTNTYIDDVVEATTTAIMNQIHGYSINISGSQPISVNQSLDIISATLNKKANIQFLEKRPGDQVSTYGDNKLAKEKLNFKESVSVEEGLRRQIDSYLEAVKKNNEK
jgi:nucleoside-diphosphate-sugar epimerase